VREAQTEVNVMIYDRNSEALTGAKAMGCVCQPKEGVAKGYRRGPEGARKGKHRQLRKEKHLEFC